MAKKKDPAQAAQVQQLRGLANDPHAQADFAVTLLQARYGPEVILAALQTLARIPHEAATTARPALLNLYQHYSSRGQKQDPAAYLRAAIVRALREIVRPADGPFLAQVTETFIFPPPEFLEEGAMLRSAALLALAEVDDDLARYHAVRLLANEHTNRMSGEPALTAAKMLAAQGEDLPLYFYVMQDSARVVPEVVSICLGNLINLRTDLLPGVISRYAEATNEVILVGLFDLLLNHQAGIQGGDFLVQFLQQSTQLDAYRYLVVTMVTSGNPDVVQYLLNASRIGLPKAKIAILREALSLGMSTDPTVTRLLEQLAPT
ncbi:MAG: hypothetical protein KF832_27575 [Caldilineaceae bacterium]|nr:hypothetical protein [Caldilineaceae bacterium]